MRRDTYIGSITSDFENLNHMNLIEIDMRRRKLVLSISSIAGITTIAGCADDVGNSGESQDTDEKRTEALDVLDQHLQAIKNGDVSTYEKTYHSDSPDRPEWENENDRESFRETLEIAEIEILDTSVGAVRESEILGSARYTWYNPETSNDEFEIVIDVEWRQDTDDEWKVWEVEVREESPVDPDGEVEIEARVRDDLNQSVEVIYEDDEMLINATTYETRFSGSPPNAGSSVFSWRFDPSKSDKEVHTGYVGTAVTESYNIPETDTEYPVLDFQSLYESHSNPRVRFELDLDELGVPNARDAEMLTSSKDENNIKTRSSLFANIEDGKLVVTALREDFAAYNTYNIELTTVDGVVETTVSRPPIDGRLELTDVVLVDEGDRAVIEESEVTVDVPERQLDKYDHRLMMATVSHDPQIGRIDIDRNGSHTIPTESGSFWGSQEVEYPMDSVEVLVTLLIGEIPIDTEIIELTSDDIQ